MASDKPTVVGASSLISGEIRGEDDLLVQGRVDGRVELQGNLTVANQGIVKADVQAHIVEVSGIVVGNVVASESVHLTSKARMVGNITAPLVAIDAGAAYRGHVDMGEIDLSRGAAQTAAASRSRGQSQSNAQSVSKTAASSKSAAESSSKAASSSPRPAVKVSTPGRPTVASARTPAWAKKKASKKRTR